MISSPYPDVEIPETPFPEFVLAKADERGDKPALIEGSTGRTITYAELASSVRALAAGLARRGLRKGDVFAHFAPNLPEYAVTFLGVGLAGAVNTTANPLMTVEELAAQLRDSGARLLVTVPELVEKATSAAEESGVEEVFVYGDADGATPFEALLAEGAAPPAVAIDSANDLIALPYSSGTTGLPKGVMLSHRNLVANLRQLTFEDRWEDWERDVIVAALPFFHIYGLVVLMNLTLYTGGTVVTMPRFEMAEFLRVIQDYRVNRLYVVPPIVLGLVKAPIVDEYDLSSLEIVNSGAAPLSAELEVACGERLGCRVKQGYGMTETSPVTHFIIDSLAGTMPGKIGPAAPNTECKILDVATGEEVEDGADGELCMRGPQVMKGYLNNPEATARTLDEDGWLHTGDIARVEPDGSLRIVDRVKELIKYKGYQVAPAELEALLLTHPDIADAAVIPIPDEEAGEIPKAFVVTSGPVTPEEVSRFVAERVSPYKKVRAVEFVDEIPKAASGKILRRVLIDRERAGAPTG